MLQFVWLPGNKHSLGFTQIHNGWVAMPCYKWESLLPSKTPLTVSSVHSPNDRQILIVSSLPWRHNKRDGVSNHLRLDDLLNRLLRRGSNKTSKLRVTGLCERNSPVTGEFPSQRASNAENVYIWWRQHAYTALAAGILPAVRAVHGGWNNLTGGCSPHRERNLPPTDTHLVVLMPQKRHLP